MEMPIKFIALQYYIHNMNGKKIIHDVYVPSTLCWDMWAAVVQTTLHMTHNYSQSHI